MSRVNFLDSIKSGITLLGDGATGSYLQTKGLEPGGCPEYMWHTAPDVIKGMAKNYFENGSDFVLTNSFGGNSFMLEKYGHKDLIKTLNIKSVRTTTTLKTPRITVNKYFFYMWNGWVFLMIRS